MDTDCSLFATPRVEVGSVYIIVCTAKELRAAVCKRFLEDGRAVKAGNGGGRHNKYSCSGARGIVLVYSSHRAINSPLPKIILV